MRIVHFSDWHGSLRALPDADLYVCTGDMYPNTQRCLWPDKEPEARFQADWAKRHASHFANLKAPVFCVRGNHDFAELYPLFADTDSFVCEFAASGVFSFGGLRFGGFRGVPPINGVWADEISEDEIAYQATLLPTDIDVLVTHGPARGYLDDSYGSKALRDFVDRGVLKAHLFGHIHERAGEGISAGGMYLSNAAQTTRVIELPVLTQPAKIT